METGSFLVYIIRAPEYTHSLLPASKPGYGQREAGRMRICDSVQVQEPNSCVAHSLVSQLQGSRARPWRPRFSCLPGKKVACACVRSYVCKSARACAFDCVCRTDCLLIYLRLIGIACAFALQTGDADGGKKAVVNGGKTAYRHAHDPCVYPGAHPWAPRHAFASRARGPVVYY